jgi:hypothetical protein
MKVGLQNCKEGIENRHGHKTLRNTYQLKHKVIMTAFYRAPFLYNEHFMRSLGTHTVTDTLRENCVRFPLRPLSGSVDLYIYPRLIKVSDSESKTQRKIVKLLRKHPVFSILLFWTTNCCFEVQMKVTVRPCHNIALSRTPHPPPPWQCVSQFIITMATETSTRRKQQTIASRRGTFSLIKDRTKSKQLGARCYSLSPGLNFRL